MFDSQLSTGASITECVCEWVRQQFEGLTRAKTESRPNESVSGARGTKDTKTQTSP